MSHIRHIRTPPPPKLKTKANVAWFYKIAIRQNSEIQEHLKFPSNKHCETWTLRLRKLSHGDLKSRTGKKLKADNPFWYLWKDWIFSFFIDPPCRNSTQTNVVLGAVVSCPKLGFFSSSCRNVGIYASARHFEPPALVGLRACACAFVKIIIPW